MAKEGAMQLQMDKEKVTGGIRVRRVIANVVLILICALCLFWFFVLFINTTRSNAALKAGFTVIPGGYLIKNFVSLFQGTLPVWNGLLNSVIISTSCAILATYFSSMTAYAIHAYDFKLKNIIFTFIMIIMTIPTQVVALGFIDMMLKWKWNNTFLPLIIPAIAAPVTFFYMKQYMDSVLPLAIIEAARIDGSGEFRTFNFIVMPMMKPAIAVQAIFCFVANWNNYFTPALLLSKDKVKTLPVLIAMLRSADFLKFDMGQVYAMITFSIFPVIVVYLVLSKFIVGGVALGSVKG